MNRYTGRTFALELVLIAVAAIFMVPILVLISVALRDPNSTPGFLGFTWPLHFENISTAWTASAMGPSLVNSIVITTVSVALIIVVASAASYTITRRTQRWSRGVFYLFLTGFLFPGQLAMLPLYLTFSKAGLVGNPVTVILIYVAGHMPFTVFLYCAFLRDLPRDYEEAATIDGAGSLRMFWTVVFPLARPVTGTVAILTALGVWNDFLNPLLYLTGGNTRTAPLSVYTFVGEYSANWPLVFSALITSVIPILVAYFLMQRFIMRGFASGLKG
ncbi:MULTISPECIES: carbohydrate ABC transporter permease [Streptomyces]|uniref:Carbohydrate ABC transporter permease n=1 Tax=Streptomyces glycanivorans TaxID=3033808 RepID=A0ABY9J5V5_9ACTN|nr:MULTISPECIES: carbohydrate ABC transporter permease [unclassified Streptomyces]WSQ76545.1 carbohydrate ABC transporter permease [Streptomyces sp. NBC_01213]TXS07869.1 carbohydrate ABC transporter permease [Streptomyces sp. wa22]WLQ63032.1 carbohydrate ABC transporter permease [Streptomyces sp. Alt3]WSQ83874.1 carbohydrate ABC transporter permease [Streptomyces sp. NBC_01212]WSR10179.1 carbohydrate ABC transporter permease [Streptomyces sp. NBC_01208]